MEQQTLLFVEPIENHHDSSSEDSSSYSSFESSEENVLGSGDRKKESQSQKRIVVTEINDSTDYHPSTRSRGKSSSTDADAADDSGYVKRKRGRPRLTPFSDIHQQKKMKKNIRSDDYKKDNETPTIKNRAAWTRDLVRL